MNTFARIAFAVVMLFAAIACYSFGIPAGGFVFVVLGVICEGLFWFGLFGKKRSS